MAKIVHKVLKRCFLKCTINRHPPIEITGEKVFIGRGPVTEIIDPNVSRQQICLKANFKEGYVLVRRMGQNPTILNIQELQLNLGYEAHSGDIIELIPGKHRYILDFEYEEKELPKKKEDDDKSEKSTSSTKQKKDVPKKDENGETISNRKRPRTGSDEKTKEKSDKRSRTTSSKDSKEPKPKEEKKSKEIEPKKLQPAATSSGSSAFDGFISEATDSKWEEMDNKALYIFTTKGVRASTRIAGYDMDGTIIKTKSGNTFPKTRDDWQIAMPEVPGKLKNLVKSDYKIVFFTNQMGVAKGKTTIDDVKWKIEAIASKLNVPIQAFVATGKGRYRKPAPGMWTTLSDLKNDGVKIEKVQSFYVGDAAGRPEIKKPVKKKKDHSCGDRLFALNLGIDFYTPEQHFQNHKDGAWTKPEFDPKSILSITDILSPKSAKLIADSCEIIVMTGCPGSGKSHFVKKYLEPKGYVVVNRDTLGTIQKCISVLEKALKEGKKAVIDNTNPDLENRKKFVDIASKFKIPCRCFMMNLTIKQCKHNNVFREMTDKSHSSVSDIVFNMFKSKYKEPTMDEGFTEICKVNFVPEFKSAAEKNLYLMYLLDN